MCHFNLHAIDCFNIADEIRPKGGKSLSLQSGGAKPSNVGQKLQNPADYCTRQVPLQEFIFHTNHALIGE